MQTPHSSRLDWFHQARFGMFVHWGPYAVGGRGEWIMNRECIPFAEYRDRYAAVWRAEHYDPREWARLARRAGMQYIVLTARHHDGFCLWDTKTTDWCATRLGPGRDLVAPFVEAVRNEGLRVGLYYSGADWHHPDYPDAYARDWPDNWPDQAAHERFIAHCRAQITELLTRYGRIDMLWYDGCEPRPFADPSFNEYVYTLQPDILLNERNGAPCDFTNSEQRIVAKAGAWEACMTLNDNWGYFASEAGQKPPEAVTRMLIMCAKDGGNLLLNVGPKPDGTIPVASVTTLTQVGTWLKANGEWLYGSSRSPFSWCEANCWLSTKGSRVYVHLLKEFGEELCIAEIGNPVLAAHWLHSGEPVAFEQRGARLFLRGLPSPLTDPLGMVIAVDVEGDPKPFRGKCHAANGTA